MLNNFTTFDKWLWLLLLNICGGSSATTLTVTGVSPLSLINAVAHSMVSLTQYGKCVQDGTPTPDASVDIMCNNGALRYGALGNNLYDPSPSLIELGYYIDASTGVKSVSATNFMLKSYIPVEAGQSYVFYGRAKTGGRMSSYNRIAWFTEDKAFISSGTYTKDRIGTGTAPSNAAYAVLSCNASGESAATGTPTTIEYVQSYDWTFCKGTAEITPFEPFVGGVKAVGTPEVLTISCNEFDPSTMGAPTNVSLANADSTGVVVNPSSRSLIFPCEPNTTYTVSFKSTPTGGTIYRVATVAERVTSQNSPVAAIAYDLDIANFAPKTINTGSDAAFMYVQFSAAYIEDIPDILVIQKGSDIIQPQTVNDVPMLLGVGDYKDEGEIISGIKTGKLGVMVLDGTENFYVSTGDTYGVAIDKNKYPNSYKDAVPVLCTHLPFSTSSSTSQTDVICNRSGNYGIRLLLNATIMALADTKVAAAKAFFASEYAKGTPVMVIYVKATETIEQTTPHSLHTAQGTNVVSVTAEVSDISLECEYKGVSS